MEKTASILILLTFVTGARAQGTVNFANTGAFTTTADRNIYNFDGSKLVGTNYVAALYYGVVATDVNQLAVKSEEDQSLLSAVGHFRDVDPTSSAAGTWSGGMRVLMGTTVGQSLFLQIRIWDIARFGTFENSVASGGWWGASNPFGYVVPAPTDAAGLKIDNFRAFFTVPEPSTLAFGALGLAALLACRMTKSRWKSRLWQRH